MHVYLDDTKRDGLWSVAGYAMSPPQAKKLAKEWKRLYPMGSHMKEMSARQGRFKGWTPEMIDKQMVSSASAIKKHAELAVAVCCHEDETREARKMLGPRGKALGLDEPYSMCCYTVLGAVLLWSTKEKRKETFVYVFEKGSKGSGSADRLLGGIVANQEHRDFFRIDSYSFEPKEPSSPLGAADMLAWEWGLEQSRTGKPDRRYPTRRSFLELLNGVPHRVYIPTGGKTLLGTIKSAQSEGLI